MILTTLAFFFVVANAGKASNFAWSVSIKRFSSIYCWSNLYEMSTLRWKHLSFPIRNEWILFNERKRTIIFYRLFVTHAIFAKISNAKRAMVLSKVWLSTWKSNFQVESQILLNQLKRFPPEQPHRSHIRVHRLNQAQSQLYRTGLCWQKMHPAVLIANPCFHQMHVWLTGL